MSSTGNIRGILDLDDQNNPVDLITVSDQLTKRGSLAKVGDYEYLSNLAVAVPTTANARHYAGIVEEKSLLRKLIHASNEISRKSYEATGDAMDVLNDAEKHIFDIVQNRNQPLVPSACSGTHFQRLELLYNHAGELPACRALPNDKKLRASSRTDLVQQASMERPVCAEHRLILLQYTAKSRLPFSAEMARQLVNRSFHGALVD